MPQDVDNHKSKVSTLGFWLSVVALLATTLSWLYYSWFCSGAAWMHPELLGTAVYIWNSPGHDRLGAMLRKVFDWKAFDPNVNRVRPLNDFTEVIDAIARPYLARWVGAHPSAMPSAFATLILAPTFLFLWTRRTIASRLPALFLCLLFVSSIGFLSDVVVYIRPAKKLNLIFSCMGLYYALCFSERRRWPAYVAMYLCILAGCFSDELGLGNFVVIGILYWKELCARGSRLFGWLYLTVPIVFLGITKYILPAIYRTWSVHGAWDALADSKKFAVFGYLLKWEFYRAASEALARSVLSTFAIGTHTPKTEAVILFCMAATVACHIFIKRLSGFRAIVSDRLILATVGLFLASTYATLLDWYPFPHQVSYLGSFNYYYHSSVPIFVAVWLSYVAATLIPPPSLRSAFWMRGQLIVLTLVGCLIVTANFRLFEHVNRAVQIIHIYPYDNQRLWNGLREVSQVPPGNQTPVPVLVVGNSDREAENYKMALQSIFGKRWNSTYFYDVMGLIAPTPIMTNAHVEHLYTASYPWTKVSVRIEQRGIRGWNP